MLHNFSQASENNKPHIARHLTHCLADASRLLEIGSGSGQHAMYIAPQLPDMTWIPSEMSDRYDALEANIAAHTTDHPISSISTPLVLDVNQQPWSVSSVDVVYTANTLHIMSWPSVQSFVAGAGRVLGDNGMLCVYGPFKYDGKFTTPSNSRFDASLRMTDNVMGIRDIEAVDSLARQQGLTLLHDHDMPANNQLLIWQRQ